MSDTDFIAGVRADLERSLLIPGRWLDPDPEHVTANESRIMGESIRARLAYQVAVMKPLTGFMLDAPIDRIDPERRRGYLRLMYATHAYRNASRRAKTSLRRALMRYRVSAI